MELGRTSHLRRRGGDVRDLVKGVRGIAESALMDVGRAYLRMSERAFDRAPGSAQV
jgi:hypothetical protein